MGSNLLLGINSLAVIDFNIIIYWTFSFVKSIIKSKKKNKHTQACLRVIPKNKLGKDGHKYENEKTICLS